MPRPEAYYSTDLKCWVRMTHEHDGEWCHTAGYATREEALGLEPLQDLAWHHPCDDRPDEQGDTHATA